MAVLKLLSCVCVLAVVVFGKPTQEANCFYDTPKGKIDLGPLVSVNGTAAFTAYDPMQAFTYLWNPCVPFSEEQCISAALCQLMTGTSFHVFMAPQDAVLQEDPSGNPVLFYTGTDPIDLQKRQSFIILLCDQAGPTTFTFINENPVKVYHFELRSKYACVASPPLTTPGTPAPRSAPTGAPTPGPGWSVMAITILLACILLCLCVLNCMVFMGLITRKTGDNSVSSGHDNYGYEMKTKK